MSKNALAALLHSSPDDNFFCTCCAGCLAERPPSYDGADDTIGAAFMPLEMLRPVPAKRYLVILSCSPKYASDISSNEVQPLQAFTNSGLMLSTWPHQMLT